MPVDCSIRTSVILIRVTEIKSFAIVFCHRVVTLRRIGPFITYRERSRTTKIASRMGLWRIGLFCGLGSCFSRGPRRIAKRGPAHVAAFSPQQEVVGPYMSLPTTTTTTSRIGPRPKLLP